MIADMISEGWHINVATEMQKGSQADFAVRGTLSSSNVMRRQFKAGDDYSEAPDTIGVYILGFNLPELQHRKVFVSRIVRAEYDSKEYFLPDKYSDYYIELPKLDNLTKEELLKEYHELWDLCVILKTKIKDQDEVIKMQAIQSPLALNLASEARKAVTPDDFVNDTMKRERGMRELQIFLNKREQKSKAVGMEEMIITAFQANAASEVIEAMQQNAGITEARLAELKKQAQAT
jgi:predicted transposase/invertase (TIGR01784 family)